MRLSRTQKRLPLFFVFLSFLFIASQSTAPVSGSDAHSVHSRMEASHSAFITWFHSEIECPVCKTKNVFMVVGSYGSYIYAWPEKYQLIFWPDTDSPTWYSCKKCRMTAHMSAFRSVPPEKLEGLKAALATVKLPAQPERTGAAAIKDPPYLSLPVSDRLAVVEKVMGALGVTDDFEWCKYYRVLGYHLEAEKKQAESDEARRKALALAEKLAADKSNEGLKKELLIISGSMRHYLRDDAGAKRDLELARSLKYSDRELSDEGNSNANSYMRTVIEEFLEMLGKGDGPRDKFKRGGE